MQSTGKGITSNTHSCMLCSTPRKSTALRERTYFLRLCWALLRKAQTIVFAQFRITSVFSCQALSNSGHFATSPQGSDDKSWAQRVVSWRLCSAERDLSRVTEYLLSPSVLYSNSNIHFVSIVSKCRDSPTLIVSC